MESGQFVHFPQPGGAMDQDERLLNAIRFAHRVWWINSYLPAVNKPPNEKDREFMEWLIGDYTPGQDIYQMDGKDKLWQIND